MGRRISHYSRIGREGEPGRLKNQEKGPREKVAASSLPSQTVTWCTLKRVPPSQGEARAQGPWDPPPGTRASYPRPEKENPREQGFQPQRRERGSQGAGPPTLDQRKRISGSRASYPRGEKEDPREQALQPQRRERGPQRAGLHSPLRPQGESQRVHVSPARPVQCSTREPVPDPR